MRFLPICFAFLLAVARWPNPPALAQVDVIDDAKREVKLPGAARRVVSLAPSVTESLFAIGAEDAVVGVTDYCNYPPAATRKPRVGGVINPNIEAVVSLHPDLIILTMEGNMREDFQRLIALGLPVFVTNPRSLDGIYHSILQLGELTGKNDSAAAVVAAMKRQEEDIRARAEGHEPVRALLIVSVHPLMCVGKNTFINQLIQLAGGKNLAERAPGTYPAYSREAVVADNPQVLIVMSDAGAPTEDLPRLFPEWSTISAVRGHCVFSIDSDRVSRPGPRAAAALESLFSLLHAPCQ
ncbi:MAG TPA: cobalamin-binding protein [Bacteroidota bacterium]|nr:cobalamin-binding protein [Bacteroidota bacterium]